MASYVLVPYQGTIIDTPRTQLSGYTNANFVQNRQNIWLQRDADIQSKYYSTPPTLPPTRSQALIDFALLNQDGERGYKRYSSYRVMPHRRKLWRAVHNDKGEEIDRVWVQGSIAYPHDVRLNEISEYQWEMNPTEQRYPSSFWNDDVYDDRFAPQVYGREFGGSQSDGVGEGFSQPIGQVSRTYWHDPFNNRIRVYDPTKIPSHAQGEPDWVQAQEPYANGVGVSNPYILYNDPNNEDDDTVRYLGRPDEYEIPQRYDEDEDGDTMGTNAVGLPDGGVMSLHTGCGVDIPHYSDKFILAYNLRYGINYPPLWDFLNPDFSYWYGVVYPNLYITWWGHYSEPEDIAKKVKFKLNGVTGIRGVKSNTNYYHYYDTISYWREGFNTYSDYNLAPQEGHSYDNSVGDQVWNSKPVFGIWRRFDTYETSAESFDGVGSYTTIYNSSGTNWNVYNGGYGGGKPRNAEWEVDIIPPLPPNTSFSHTKHLKNSGYDSYIYDMTNGYKPMITDFDWGRKFII